MVPIHPKPTFEKTLGEWIEPLSVANHISFKEMFLYIVKYAKDGELNKALTKLTRTNFYYYKIKINLNPDMEKIL